jgi:CRP-like cAMP-binding protein
MNKEKTYNVESFAKDQIIFKEGDESKYAYLVQSGSVEIFRLVNNNHVIVNQIKQGEMFGEMGIVSSAPRVASAKASEKSRLIKFDQDDVLADLKKSPKIINALTHLLIKRFEILDNELREQHGSDMFMKITYLLELLDTPKSDTHFVPYNALIERAKQLINASQVEIDEAIHTLSNLSLVQLEDLIDANTNQKIKFVHILNAEKLTRVAKTYYETMTKKNQDRNIGEVAFLGIKDLANELGISEDRIFNRIRSSEIPLDLIYFHKASIEKWLNKKTRESFD